MPKKLDATPLYRRIIMDAWHIAWDHKHLWFFGFFATLIGFGGVFEVMFNAYDKSVSFLPSETTGSLAYGIPGITTIRALLQFSPHPLLSIVVFMAIASLLTAVFVWVVGVSIGGLVGSVGKIARGSDSRIPEGLRIGAEKFWPVFGVNALAKIIIAGGMFLTGTNLIFLNADRSALSALLYVVSFVIFTALAVIVTLISIFATNYAVLKNERLSSAIDKAWKMLSMHWLISIEMTIVLFVAGLLLGITIAACALIASLPLFFLILLSLSVGATGIAFALLTVMMAIAVVALALAASLLTTFQVSSWTLLWEELSGNKRSARLLHFAEQLRGRFLKK